MEDKHLTSEELEAFEQHEAELLADEQSITEEVEKLGLNKMSRELLERMAAKWHLELSVAARDFEQSLSLNKKVVDDYLKIGSARLLVLLRKQEEKLFQKLSVGLSKLGMRTV